MYYNSFASTVNGKVRERVTIAAGWNWQTQEVAWKKNKKKTREGNGEVWQKGKRSRWRYENVRSGNMISDKECYDSRINSDKDQAIVIAKTVLRYLLHHSARSFCPGTRYHSWNALTWKCGRLLFGTRTFTVISRMRLNGACILRMENRVMFSVNTVPLVTAREIRVTKLCVL